MKLYRQPIQIPARDNIPLMIRLRGKTTKYIIDTLNFIHGEQAQLDQNERHLFDQYYNWHNILKSNYFRYKKQMLEMTEKLLEFNQKYLEKCDMKHMSFDYIYNEYITFTEQQTKLARRRALVDQEEI